MLLARVLAGVGSLGPTLGLLAEDESFELVDAVLGDLRRELPVLRRRADVPEVYVDRVRRRWIAWGELILRVFRQDPQTCPGCGGRMRQVALVAESGDALRWLDDEHVLPTGGRGRPGSARGAGAW